MLSAVLCRRRLLALGSKRGVDRRNGNKDGCGDASLARRNRLIVLLIAGWGAIEVGEEVFGEGLHARLHGSGERVPAGPAVRRWGRLWPAVAGALREAQADGEGEAESKHGPAPGAGAFAEGAEVDGPGDKEAEEDGDDGDDGDDGEKHVDGHGGMVALGRAFRCTEGTVRRAGLRCSAPLLVRRTNPLSFPSHPQRTSTQHEGQRA